jgi:hypothetical protein
MGLNTFECAMPGCENFVSLDSAIELIEAADEKEFEVSTTAPLISVPVDGWRFLGTAQVCGYATVTGYARVTGDVSPPPPTGSEFSPSGEGHGNGKY